MHHLKGRYCTNCLVYLIHLIEVWEWRHVEWMQRSEFVSVTLELSITHLTPQDGALSQTYI